MRIPYIDIQCLGYKCGNPLDEYDYDFEYETGIVCDDCVCCHGEYNPKNGKRINLVLRIIQRYRLKKLYNKMVKTMEAEKVLENLKKIAKKTYNKQEDLAEDIIYAFEDFEENGETYVIVEDANYCGYNLTAYINTEDSTEFFMDMSYKTDKSGNRTDFVISDDVYMVSKN